MFRWVMSEFGLLRNKPKTFQTLRLEILALIIWFIRCGKIIPDLYPNPNPKPIKSAFSLLQQMLFVTFKNG